MTQQLRPAAVLALCLAVLACGGRPPAGPHSPVGASPATASRGAASAPSAIAAGSWRFDLDAPAVRGRRGMVVTADPYASKVGQQVLAQGGNAVDAAVATAFALAVTFPNAGNLGGGGFMVVRLADGTRAALDFREMAPAAAGRDMYLDAKGEMTDRSLLGPLAAGVPGSTMGLWQAHQRFGARAWPDLVEPAIRLAEGFEVHASLHHGLKEARDNLSHLSGAGLDPFAGTLAQFYPGGRSPRLGSTFRQPELAATLRRIAERGPDGFYRGETAEHIVRAMEPGGGIITAQDLEDYVAVWREPISLDYRGHTVISMPPVSSGGATMGEIANILEGWDLSAFAYDSTEHLHLLAEAMRRGFCDRNHYLGDPDFVTMPLDQMISDEYAERRRKDISLQSATASSAVGPALGPADHGSDTTHFSIVDGDGNAVSVTTTLNTSYGSMVTVAGAGFLLNNEMDDFAANPGHPNAYGLVQGEANAIQGGKRMLSSMTPTIVLDPDDRLLLVTGSPGGSRIISAVFQTVSGVIDYGLSDTVVVAAPRMHHQHLPDRIYVEKGGFSASTLRGLERLGHEVHPVDHLGEVQAIYVHPDGTLAGIADPRGHGTAEGF